MSSRMGQSLMITKLSNLFSSIDLDGIEEAIALALDQASPIADTALGRNLLTQLTLPPTVVASLTSMCSDLLGLPLSFSGVGYAEYSSAYGFPVLPPHHDRDTNILVVDYQLSSNTTWELGVGLKLYPLEDNSALIFNANENIHWRPRKSFVDGESIRMLFFRFRDPSSPVDYSYLPADQQDPIFDEVKRFRDSL